MLCGVGEPLLRAKGMIVYYVVLKWCDTHEAVHKPWLLLEVAIPENEATHCRLSSMKNNQ